VVYSIAHTEDPEELHIIFDIALPILFDTHVEP
jgi:hypothetical protein